MKTPKILFLHPMRILRESFNQRMVAENRVWVECRSSPKTRNQQAMAVGNRRRHPHLLRHPRWNLQQVPLLQARLVSHSNVDCKSPDRILLTQNNSRQKGKQQALKALFQNEAMSGSIGNLNLGRDLRFAF